MPLPSKYSDARKREDSRAIREATANSPLMMVSDVSRPEDRAENAKTAIEKGIVWGTGLPASLMTVLSPAGLRTALMAQSPGNLLQAAGENDLDAAKLALGSGVLGMLGAKAIPLALGAGAGMYVRDSEASPLPTTIKQSYQDYLSSRRSSPDLAMADGGGVLSRFKETQRRREDAANRKASVSQKLTPEQIQTIIEQLQES